MTQGPAFLDEPSRTPPVNAAASSREPQITAAKPIEGPGWIEAAPGDKGAIKHSPTTVLPAPTTARPLLSIGAVGLVFLVISLALFSLGNFVADQFARATWLGILTSFLIGPGLLVLTWSAFREWQSYVGLSQIDAVRKGLETQDIAAARAHAEAWMLSAGVSEDTRSAVTKAPDVTTLRELLKSGPVASIQDRAGTLGRSAALQTLAATAVSPWPALDGVIVLWRGFRLVRQVAHLYGHRPGMVGTLALFRRIAADASVVAAADVAVSSATEALLNSPIAGGLAGQAAGAAVAARRMLRLAHATSESCKPV